MSWFFGICHVPVLRRVVSSWPCLCLCFLDGHIEGRNGGNVKKEEGKKLIVYYELFEISTEDSGRKARGVIVERSGVSPLRFGLGSKVLVLQGLEEFR